MKKPMRESLLKAKTWEGFKKQLLKEHATEKRANQELSNIANRFVKGDKQEGGAKRDINDLALLARYLPEEYLEQIFTYENVKQLVKSMFKRDDNFKFDNDENSKKTRRELQLAACLVDIGIERCIDYYKSKVESNPRFNKDSSIQFKDVVNKCNEISLKAQLQYRQEIGKKDKRKLENYLFNCKNIEIIEDSNKDWGEDVKEFIKLCEDELHIQIQTVNRIFEDPSNYDSEIINFKVSDYFDQIYDGYISVVREKQVAFFSAYHYDDAGKKYSKSNKVIPIIVDGKDNVYVYKSKKDVSHESKMIKIQETCNEESLDYLFNWNNILFNWDNIHSDNFAKLSNDDLDLFLKFCSKKANSGPIVRINYFHKIQYYPAKDYHNKDIENSSEDNILNFEFITRSQNMLKGFFKIDRVGNEAFFDLIDTNHLTHYQSHLVIKIDDDDVYVFKKKNDTDNVFPIVSYSSPSPSPSWRLNLDT